MKEILKSFFKNYRHIIIAVVLIVAVLLIAGFFLYFRKISKPPVEKPLSPEEVQKQIIDSLTAPEGEEVKVPKEVMESLSAPTGTEPTPVPDDVLKNLTAPK